MAHTEQLNKKHVLVYAGSHSQYRFFHRCSRAVNLLGYEVIFLTPKPSLAIQARIDRRKCYLLVNPASAAINAALTQTTEIVSKLTTLENGAQLFDAILERSEQLLGSHDISFVFIWNGHSIASKALATFAKSHSLPTLFFELSNIPGKIFVDKMGVNAYSSIFHNPQLLDQFQVDAAEYERWKTKYLASKKNETLSPMAAQKNRIQNFLFPLDLLGGWFHTPVIGRVNVGIKLRSFLRKGRSHITDHPGNRPYIFFPMQVSDDSQIIFNSDVGLKRAIEIAYKRAVDLGLDLLVKPHPVEDNETVLRELGELKKREGLFVTNASTFLLITNCQGVVTINSTVGLEAMILGKPVTFLGRTFYQSFTPERMKAYLMRYLITIDYFSDEEIPGDTMKEVLSRA